MRNYPEGSFMWAYEQAKEGKKVIWDKEIKTEFDKNLEKLYWVDGKTTDKNLVTLNRNTIDGWEIFEEENKVGDFKVQENGYIFSETLGQLNKTNKILSICGPTQLEDLEKAIKKAKEVRDKK
jgi:hypothetical protein